MSGEQAAFEAHWPEVEAKLRRVLAARRVPPDDREDLVQEVAARALASGMEFASPESLFAWSSTVVRHLHVDAIRRNERWRSCLGSLALARVDVDAEIEARLDVAVATEFVAGLSASDRHALLGNTGGTRQPGAFYVQRHRLRNKLQQAIEAVGSFWIGIERRLRVTSSEPVAHAAAVLAPVAAACALVLGQLAIDRTPPVLASRPDAAAPARVPSSPTRPTPAVVAVPGAADAASGASHRAAVRSGAPAGDPVDAPPRWPEQRFDVNAGGQDAFVELDSKEGPQPLWCIANAVVIPDTCVGQAPNLDDLPTG